MSEDKDQPAKSPSDANKTVIGTGDRRPGEYSMNRKEVSGARPMPVADGTGRREGIGLIKPSEKTIVVE